MSIQNFIINILEFINSTVIPFMMAVAFVYFLWNIAKYFIIEGGDTAKEEGRRNAIYGILGFVVIVSLWGIVNLMVVGLGFDRENAIVPDYMASEGYTFTEGGVGGGGGGYGNCILGIECVPNSHPRLCRICLLEQTN